MCCQPQVRAVVDEGKWDTAQGVVIRSQYKYKEEPKETKSNKDNPTNTIEKTSTKKVAINLKSICFQEAA